MLKRHMNFRSESREWEGKSLLLMNQFQKSPFTRSSPHPSTPSSEDGKCWLSLLAPLCYCYPHSECGQRKWVLGQRAGTLTEEDAHQKRGLLFPRGDLEVLTSRWDHCGPAAGPSGFSVIHRKAPLDHEGPWDNFKFTHWPHHLSREL